MGTVQKSYRTDYNEIITKIDNAFIQLDNELESGTITQDEYNTEKYQLTKDYSTILENKHLEDMIYDNIESEDDKELYAASTAFLSGDLTACKGVADLINAMYRTSPGVFESFTESPQPVQNRTFTMGEKYYNGVIQAAANNNVIFNSLGIECKRDKGEFIVPKDPKAILQFAECYATAVGFEREGINLKNIAATIEAVFSDTANNFFNGETRETDHEILIDLGLVYAKARNNVTRIEKDNGIRPYYMPIISPGESDITRMQKYVFGDNTTELNLIDDNLLNALQGADLQSYKIYANDADVIAENGGNAELYETNNPKTKEELQILIRNAKKEDIKFSFATCGYEYGTMVNIKKNDGFVKCFISELFPSVQAEEYVRSPMFKAKAFLDVVKARRGGGKVAHRNFLGSYYSGNFYAFGDKLYYKVDGRYEDNKYPLIGDATALALRTYTLMFEQMCLNKQHLDNVTNVELPNENDIVRFLTNTDENGERIPGSSGTSLVDILHAITGDDEDVILKHLMEHYYTYYK